MMTVRGGGVIGDGFGDGFGDALGDGFGDSLSDGLQALRDYSIGKSMALPHSDHEPG